MDFSNYSGTLNHTICLNITLIDNDVFEERRLSSFKVVLSVSDNYSDVVTLGNHQAVVEIMDDDCKYMLIVTECPANRVGSGFKESL